jgi:predicted RNA-binding protein with RPS1 domain
MDQESKKIALSIRRAAPEQWEQMITRYQVGDVVPGVITKLVAFGAFARLPGPVEGLVHVSELVDRRIGHPDEVVQEGDIVPLKIVRIEHDRHRLGLSLREARNEALLRGWQFDADGRVTELPEEAEKAFPDESKAAPRSERLAVRPEAAEPPSKQAAAQQEREAEQPRQRPRCATRLRCSRRCRPRCSRRRPSSRSSRPTRPPARLTRPRHLRLRSRRLPRPLLRHRAPAPAAEAEATEGGAGC